MPHPDRNSITSGLTEREAFLAMSEFIWRFACRAGDDLLTLVGDTELLEDGEPTDPAAWDDWTDCVRAVRAGEPLRLPNDS
jgi:hypothetical protein